MSQHPDEPQDLDPAGESPSAVGGSSESDPTPLDGEEFLAANRKARDRHRAEAARREAKAAEKAERSGRVPGKVVSEGSSRRFSLDVRSVIIAVLGAAVVVLAATTGFFAYQASGDSSSGVSDQTRTEVMDAAKRYAAELATYDAGDYADLDRRIGEISTPEFTRTYIDASQEAREGNTEAGGRSQATSDEAGIQSIGDGTAVVLVTLDQTVTSPQVAEEMPEGIPYQSRVKITLVEREGKWLLDNLETV